MPLGRFQRALDAAQERFGGPPMASDEAVRLGNIVTYVVLLGSDRTDRERVLYGDGAEVASAAGDQPSVVLAADTDLELVAVFCSRQDGILDGRVITEPVTVAPGNLPPFRTSEGSSAGRVLGTTGVYPPSGPPFNSLQRVTLELPICPLILPKGMLIRVFHEGNAATLRVGFFWRALG